MGQSLARRKVRQGQRKQEIKLQKKNCKTSCCTGALNSLQTLLPHGLNTIRDDGWEEVEMAVDSGASETVISEEMVQSADLKEGTTSRRGVEYQVANGERIPNLGEKKFSAWTEEGVSRNIKAQVCAVSQALLSVKRLVEFGTPK